MPQFDDKKAYAAQGETFFDDGREIELLHFVYSRPNLEELRGNPQKVLEAIDEYGRTQRYLMNVGEDKGRIVTELISQVQPKVMVELGGYVGYSCILFGAALRAAGGHRYFSLERNPEFAAVIASLASLAGLGDVVQVVVGASDSSLRRLHASGQLGEIDLLFLDHYKPAYLPDLKLCEELGLVGPGSVLAADNVIKPGNPPYLQYVRSTVAEKTRAVASEGSNGTGTEGFADRTAKQYEQRQGTEHLDSKIRGVPELEYESQLIESFEPTGEPDGIEVTKCVGRRS